MQIKKKFSHLKLFKAGLFQNFTAVTITLSYHKFFSCCKNHIDFKKHYAITVIDIKTMSMLFAGEEIPEAPGGLRELPALSGSLQPGSDFPHGARSTGSDFPTVSQWFLSIRGW